MDNYLPKPGDVYILEDGQMYEIVCQFGRSYDLIAFPDNLDPFRELDGIVASSERVRRGEKVSPSVVYNVGLKKIGKDMEYYRQTLEKVCVDFVQKHKQG